MRQCFCTVSVAESVDNSASELVVLVSVMVTGPAHNSHTS